ncbi:hypothetical protein MNV49_006296 [Pseudohyphozyma bogoriensis]|nr:hypothetical protein MNV49_006296 [Pseudohyphozyma bogoriensis]
MVKSEDQVIREFNHNVNMTVPELEKWLKTPESNSAGWPSRGGGESGESVGILKRNPKKDRHKYTKEDIQHMRKVASYCGAELFPRHLKQEGHLKNELSEEELLKRKSTRSLMNWGCDPRKLIMKPSTPALASLPQPFVLTLLLDPATQSHLDSLRRAHFPPHRNHLAAHLTLFHALPASSLASIKADLAHLCDLTTEFEVKVGPVFKLSNRGVGIDVESPEGKKTQWLRAKLLKRWISQGVELTNQDRMNFTRPHVTIQNKVTEEEAKDTFEVVNKDWKGWRGKALGFGLFEYQKSGKWLHQEDFPFKGSPK